MSRENVETARRGYEHFNRTGEPDYSVLDPEIVCHDFPELPDTGVYRGHQGFLALIANAIEGFDEFKIEPQEFIDAGDQVVVLVRTVGRGKLSGADAEVAHVWMVRNGKVVELRLYGNRDQALEAARSH
jgi:ketosteroid isomerase-like protein